MSDTAIALRVLLASAAFIAFCWLLVVLVRGAKRGGKGNNSGDPPRTD